MPAPKQLALYFSVLKKNTNDSDVHLKVHDGKVLHALADMRLGNLHRVEKCR